MSPSALVLDLLADHVRKCLVLTDDLVAIQIIQEAARKLYDRAAELNILSRPPGEKGELP